MVAAENFVSELDAKNQPSIQRIVDALTAATPVMEDVFVALASAPRT